MHVDWTSGDVRRLARQLAMHLRLHSQTVPFVAADTVLHRSARRRLPVFDLSRDQSTLLSTDTLSQSLSCLVMLVKSLDPILCSFHAIRAPDLRSAMPLRILHSLLPSAHVVSGCSTRLRHVPFLLSIPITECVDPSRSLRVHRERTDPILSVRILRSESLLLGPVELERRLPMVRTSANESDQRNIALAQLHDQSVGESERHRLYQPGCNGMFT